MRIKGWGLHFCKLRTINSDPRSRPQNDLHANRFCMHVCKRAAICVFQYLQGLCEPLFSVCVLTLPLTAPARLLVPQVRRLPTMTAMELFSEKQLSEPPYSQAARAQKAMTSLSRSYARNPWQGQLISTMRGSQIECGARMLAEG